MAKEASRRKRTRDSKIITRVCKQTLTKAVPKRARIVTKGDQRFVRFKHKGRPVKALVIVSTKGKHKGEERVVIETDEWYVRYKNAGGNWKWAKGYTDREATEKLCADIRKREERRQAGIVDPFEEHYKRPLVERIEYDRQGRITRIVGGHLADFQMALSKKNRSQKGVWQKVKQVARVLTACGFKLIPDIQAFPVEIFLGDLLDSGQISAQTYNHYLSAMQQFCRWLVKNRRTVDNPLVHLEPRNVEEDRRRVRRDLSAEEVQRLLEATVCSRETFRRLTPADRFVIYYLALGSGLRLSELASLIPESFDLDADIPIVTVEACVSKRGRRDEQPLQPDLAGILRDYLADKPAGERVWPGSWWRKAAEMLRMDLEAAGIPYVDSVGRYADFHAQRHTYITVAGRSLPPKMAQLLARHSDYRTTERYTHLQLHDKGLAAAQLPPLLPSARSEVLRATGTAGQGIG